MFFLNYIVFILLILFTHLIALSTQMLSSKKYFFGVYINEINIEEDFKIKVNKDFKRKLNISLLLSIMIYLILKNIFNLNIGTNIIICTTLYLVLFFIILVIEYKKVEYIKNTYLSNLKLKSNEQQEEKIVRINIKEDEILSEEKKKLIKKFKVLFGVCLVLSCVSFLYVIINYKNMPDIIITHWGEKVNLMDTLKKVFLMYFLLIL